MPSSTVITRLLGAVRVLSRSMSVALLVRLSFSSTQSMSICTTKSSPQAALIFAMHSVTKRARSSKLPMPYWSVRVLWKRERKCSPMLKPAALISSALKPMPWMVCARLTPTSSIFTMSSTESSATSPPMYAHCKPSDVPYCAHSSTKRLQKSAASGAASSPAIRDPSSPSTQMNSTPPFAILT